MDNRLPQSSQKASDVDYNDPELKKYLDERKPRSFGSMVECMSWYVRTRKEFMKLKNGKSDGTYRG